MVDNDPSSPNFGLETDQTSPNFGLAVQEPKQPSGIQQVGEAIQKGLDIGSRAYLGGLLGGGIPLHKLAFPEEAKLVESPLIPETAITPVIKTIQKYQPSLLETAFGEKGKALSNFASEFAGQQLAGFTSPESLALAAGGGVVGKMPRIREIAFGKPPPITPEAMPQIPETPITDTVQQQPIIPEERFPSLLRSDENLRRGELQQQLNKERGFELVPEPPPEIAPAPTLEQTLETAQVPEPRVSPETGFEFPNEPIETRTNVPSETARIGGEENATQEGNVQESVQPERTGDGQGGTPAEASSSGSVQPTEEIAAQEGQVAEPVPQPEQPSPVSQVAESTTVEPKPKTEGVVPQETGTGGVSAARLEERPINAPPPGEGVGWEETRAFGNEWLDKGGNINKVIADFNRTGKVDEWDVGKGAAYLERLQAATDRAKDALRENPSDPVLQNQHAVALAQEQRFTDAYRPMATTASNTLKGFQGKVPLTDDMADSLSALERKYGEIQGRQMTPEEVVKADRLVKQNAKAKTDVREATNELYRKADVEYGRIRSERAGPPTLEDIGRIFGEKLKEVCET